MFDTECMGSVSLNYSSLVVKPNYSHQIIGLGKIVRKVRIKKVYFKTGNYMS